MDPINVPPADGKKVITISRKKVVLGIVMIVIFALLVQVIRAWIGVRLDEKMGAGIPSPTVDIGYPIPNEPSFSRGPGYGYGYNYDGYQRPDITDTREFIKTTYAAAIKTRNVSKIVKDVTNIIKGSDGRIDNTYSSDKAGYVYFVVPKSKFESFRDQIESLTSKKLISVTTSESNLLNQKQNIESQQSDVNSTIARVTKEYDTETASYNKDIKTINANIDRVYTQLAQVRSNISNSTDQADILELRNTETNLLNQLNSYKNSIKSRTDAYNIQKENFERILKQQNTILDSVNKQDTQFTNNIETVNGTIDVQWVSLWRLFAIYTSISPFWVILIILIVLFWWFRRRNKIVFV